MSEREGEGESESARARDCVREGKRSHAPSVSVRIAPSRYPSSLSSSTCEKYGPVNKGSTREREEEGEEEEEEEREREREREGVRACVRG